MQVNACRMAKAVIFFSKRKQNNYHKYLQHSKKVNVLIWIKLPAYCTFIKVHKIIKNVSGSCETSVGCNPLMKKKKLV